MDDDRSAVTCKDLMDRLRSGSSEYERTGTQASFGKSTQKQRNEINGIEQIEYSMHRRKEWRNEPADLGARASWAEPRYDPSEEGAER